jgi:uncharacterized coiled-coil DUF342 family protein
MLFNFIFGYKTAKLNYFGEKIPLVRNEIVNFHEQLKCINANTHADCGLRTRYNELVNEYTNFRKNKNASLQEIKVFCERVPKIRDEIASILQQLEELHPNSGYRLPPSFV